MKEDTIEKIEEEITKQTKMTEDAKGKLRKEIFINIIIAIVIIAYFVFIVLGSLNTVKITRINDLRIASLVLLGIAIILFEVAYKKDSIKIAINGIEVIIVAIITLFLPYIIYELNQKYQRYCIASGSLIAVYYVVKSIVLANRAQAHYKKEKSDIKDITKKEGNKESFLDEEVEEIKKINKKENKKQSKKVEKKPTKKEETKKETKNKKETKTKKETKNKKETKIEPENKDTKKAKNAKEEKETVVTEPIKRRGRPKKVVVVEEPVQEKPKTKAKKTETKKKTEAKTLKGEVKKEQKETKKKTTKKKTTKKKTTKKETKKKEEPKKIEESNPPKKRGRPRKVDNK